MVTLIVPSPRAQADDFRSVVKEIAYIIQCGGHSGRIAPSHVHFIDGAQNGYALAAAALKQTKPE